MITHINGRHLSMIRGGAAAKPAHHNPSAEHDEAQDSRSPLSRNVEALVLDAYSAGLHQGEAQHFRQGWRWGLVAGLLPGAISGVSLVLLLQWIGAA